MNMQRPKVLLVIFSVFVSSLILFSCSDDDNGTSPSASATIRGKVTNDAGLSKTTGAVGDAKVKIHSVQADGSFENVSTATVETNAEGKFSVETNADYTENTVCTAEKGDNEWQTMVTAMSETDIDAEATYYAQPMTTESTVEAKAYQEVIAHGQSDDVLYADMASSVNADLAAEMSGDANIIADFAVAVENMVRGRNDMMAGSHMNVAQSDIEAAAGARIEAQAALEERLYMADGNETEEEAAFETFYESDLSAFINAGVNSKNVVKARSASGHFLRIHSNPSGNMAFEIEKQSKLRASMSMESALTSEFTHAGASEAQVQGAADACAQLQADIKAAESSADLEQATDEFKNRVFNGLKLVLSGQEALLITLDGTIAGSAGLTTTLESSVAAASTNEEIISAYAEFFSEVDAAVNSSLSGMSDAKINAATEIYILMNVLAPPDIADSLS